MAAFVLDTSALVRRYDSSESGSALVRSLCAPARGHDLLLARIAGVEVASALSRKVREGSFTIQRSDRVWRQFRGHWRDQYQPIQLTEGIFIRAEHLARVHPLRAYDAVYVASALDVAARLPGVGLEFWTADHRQAQVAAAEGLAVRLVG